MNSKSKKTNYSSYLSDKEKKNIKILSYALSNLINNNVIFEKKYLSSKNENNLNNTNKNNNSDKDKLFINTNSYLFLKDKPEISIYEYLSRIMHFFDFELSSLILALYYIDKLISKKYLLNNYNIHLTLFTCLMISVKMNEDICISSKYYSSIAMVDECYIYYIEKEILELLDYELILNIDNYIKYKKFFK